jgi:hypothetical protein
MNQISRRQFIQKTAVAGASLAVAPMIFVPKARAFWEKKSIVHPNVNNLRVVGITDPRMINGVRPVTSWSLQEKMVVKDAVWENLDKLACGLVETRNPEDAWRAVFIKPPQKSWTQTVVAIKTNNISLQHTRSAVMSKVCRVFTDLLGVRGTNIHIFDGVHGGSMGKSTPFAGLPEGVRIEDQWGGIDTPVPVPPPWGDGRRTTKCLRPLAEGKVDIMVNIALCKGHSDNLGGFTMTLKNHMGTFYPMYIHQDEALEYLLAVNQTPQVLGPMDPRTGRVLFPLQQLCIVDALWASEGGPGGYPRTQPNFLAMGVLSPVVDYVLATRFRKEKMGWDINKEATRRMLTEFGYRESDLPAGGKLVEL